MFISTTKITWQKESGWPRNIRLQNHSRTSSSIACSIRKYLADFPDIEGKYFFDRDQKRLKFQFAPDEVKAGLLRNLLIEFSSKAFLTFLEEMTGIDGLIADHHFAGRGLHETRQNGHLSIHADFNVRAAASRTTLEPACVFER